MIKEAYVSFEVAKLLKEKGFNESCYTYYDNIDNSINRFDKGLHFNNTSYPWGVPYDVSKAKKYIVAPTHQMAMAWLREMYGTYIVFFHTRKSGWWYNITDMDTSYVLFSSEKTQCSYEEAVEAALKYVLENLI